MPVIPVNRLHVPLSSVSPPGSPGKTMPTVAHALTPGAHDTASGVMPSGAFFEVHVVPVSENVRHLPEGEKEVPAAIQLCGVEHESDVTSAGGDEVAVCATSLHLPEA